MTDYKLKYLKYKRKYLELKGGSGFVNKLKNWAGVKTQQQKKEAAEQKEKSELLDKIKTNTNLLTEIGQWIITNLNNFTPDIVIKYELYMKSIRQMNSLVTRAKAFKQSNPHGKDAEDLEVKTAVDQFKKLLEKINRQLTTSPTESKESNEPRMKYLTQINNKIIENQKQKDKINRENAEKRMSSY